MGLPTGSQLGPYEIESASGVGGMGEVYRALDKRLDRIVAIKVLPSHLADRAELRERFDREARTIASLNHPHICVLHDVGHQDGVDFLVLEYLEGETLAARLAKGPLPLAQVLQFAIEIADALDKAHRKGVIHRDLKPGNIMLTKTGTKLLDFGLAKLRQEAAPALSSSQLPTMKDAITAQGTIMGTLQYMAPEQMEGEGADARTDIFAFGVVVYEMATGKKAFDGKSQASVISAIMTSDPPPMSSLQPMAPQALERVVKQCLAKDPDSRWQSASDLVHELRWIDEGGSEVAMAPAVAARVSRALGRRTLVFGLVALVLGAAAATLATWRLNPSPPMPVGRLEITLPAGQQLVDPDSGAAVALSPDGTYLAYVARRGNIRQLYLRAIDSLEARLIPGTEEAISPFFSPDGQWVGFYAGGKLKKVSVGGGAVLTLSEVTVLRGGSWSSQGTIIFAPTSVAELRQVSDAGGTPQSLTHLGKGEFSHRWPEVMPDGKAVLFTATTADAPQVAVQSLGNGEHWNLALIGTYPRYATSGHLIYAQGGNLMAAPFDPQRLQVTGNGVPVVEGVRQSTFTGAAQYSFSRTGLLAYVPGGVQAAQRRLVWVTRNGTEQPLAAPVRAYLIPRLSPDGRRIAVGITEQDTQLWLYDVTRETLTRLTFEGSLNAYPSWTPDGKRIAFASNKAGRLPNVYRRAADGSGEPERLTTSESIQMPGSWSADGRALSFVEINPTTGYDIGVLGDHGAQSLLRTSFTESAPQFSPDGHWLAYISDESGRREVYVQPYPGPGGKWQISTDGGTEPMWNRNGRELFYRVGNKMMSVPVTTRPSFSVGKPKMLFEAQYEPTSGTISNYDVSPDGKRFLMIKPSEQEAATTQINVVLNWFEELKRRVPSRTK